MYRKIISYVTPITKETYNMHNVSNWTNGDSVSFVLGSKDIKDFDYIQLRIPAVGGGWVKSQEYTKSQWFNKLYKTTYTYSNIDLLGTYIFEFVYFKDNLVIYTTEPITIEVVDRYFSGDSTNTIPLLVNSIGHYYLETSVTLEPASCTIAISSNLQFVATVIGSDNPAVFWYVDGILNGNITTGTITNTGLYFAPGILGTHTVTATSVADPTKSASSIITLSA